MSAAKYRPTRGPGETLAGLGASAVEMLRGRRWIVLAVVVLAGGTWGGFAIWQQVRDFVAAHDEYRLTAADIEITPPPPWVRGDIRAQVLRDAGLGPGPDGGMSILDDQLVERLHQAFSLHPWVERVERVSKRHPAHVDVELVYRRPAAMVEIPGAEGAGLYPVDADGVLLPSSDFSPVEALVYPRLAGVESSPLGPVGMRWGDPVVAGGARIAAVLQPQWATLNLWSIRWVKPSAGSDASAPAIYDLTAAGGNVIHWGAAPGSEPPGEPTAEKKLARLQSIAARSGTLDAPAAKGLDLRRPDSTAGARQKDELR